MLSTCGLCVVPLTINKGILNVEGPIEEVLLNKLDIKGAKDWA